MRIVQVLLSPRIGGAETLVASLSARFAEAGVDSPVLYLDPPGGKRSRIRRVLQLRRSLRAARPNAVLAHSAIPGTYTRLVGRRDVPTLLVLHSAGDDYASPRSALVERVLQSRTAAVVAVSEAQASAYRARFPAARVQVIPNGMRDGLPLVSASTAPRAVVTLARVAEQKRPRFWEQVAALAESRPPVLRFRWFGPIEAFAEDDDFVGRHGGAAHAVLEGPTSAPGAVLEAAGLLFHPAAEEGHPIAVLEAMASGVPVVCADTVGALLPEDAPLLQYPADDPDAAAARIGEAVEAWGRVQGEAIAYAASVRDRFSMRRCADAYLELLRGLVERS